MGSLTVSFSLILRFPLTQSLQDSPVSVVSGSSHSSLLRRDFHSPFSQDHAHHFMVGRSFGERWMPPPYTNYYFQILWQCISLLLKHNDNFPLSVRANAIDSHSAPRYWRTFDNNDDKYNDKHLDISFDKYRGRYQLECFKSYWLCDVKNFDATTLMMIGGSIIM